METSLVNPYLLFRCTACGTARTTGSAPVELYATGTYQQAPARAKPLVDTALRVFSGERLRIAAEAAAPPARLLDVGAGRGRFVLAASQAGYLAHGIEPVRERVAEATRSGASVEQAGIANARVEPGSLDIVTMWHVLEHVEDPAGSLRRVSHWLAPGGYLVLAIPNFSSVQARVGGSRWFHLDVPRHRTHFTREGLVRLLMALDLRIVRERHILFEHNVLGMWQTWLNRLTVHPGYLYNLLKRNAPLSLRDLLATALAVPLLPFAAFAELLSGLARQGGTIVVIARANAKAACGTEQRQPRVTV
jgi:2-polyprenyl-3-methyl-5-hydroxy-6-metoxy-1,4-benzoquinol methylase